MPQLPDPAEKTEIAGYEIRQPLGLEVTLIRATVRGSYRYLSWEDGITHLATHLAAERSYCGEYVPQRVRDMTAAGEITCLMCLNLIIKRALRLQ